MFVGVACVAQETASPAKSDAQEIMRQSLSHWRRSLDAAKNYTF
jgi:hypothetical protein